MEGSDYQRHYSHSESKSGIHHKLWPFTEDIKCSDSHMGNVKAVAERMLRLWYLFSWPFSTEEERDRCQEWNWPLLKLEKNLNSTWILGENKTKQSLCSWNLQWPQLWSSQLTLLRCVDSLKRTYTCWLDSKHCQHTEGRMYLKFTRQSDARHPEVLTSTRFQKHIATMTQVLNLQENEAGRLRTGNISLAKCFWQSRRGFSV